MTDFIQRPMQHLPKVHKPSSLSSSPQTVKKKTSEAAAPTTSHIDDVRSQTQEATDNGTQNIDEFETVDEEEGTEAAGSVDEEGRVVDETGRVVGHVTGEKAKLLKGSLVDKEGDVLDSEGNVIGKADLIAEAVGALGSEKPDVEAPELAAPFGVQDNGEITNASGEVVGKLAEGEPRDLVGTSIKDIDADGNLKAESGSTIGKAEITPELLEKVGGAGSEIGSHIPEEVPGDATSKAPLDAKSAVEGAGSAIGSHVPAPEDATSKVEGVEGEGVEGELPTGDIKDEVEGAADEVAAAEVPDLSILKGKKVNKLGKIVSEDGTPFGVLIEGDPKKLIGKKVDENGCIWDDSGKVIGKAELLPEKDREAEPSAPFEDFPDAVLDKSGNVIFEGRIVGKLIEGEAKKLEGKKVDADGDVLDKNGNVLGKAERYQEEDIVPEAPEVADLSAMEGMKVNKAGNVVDENGKLFGRVITGALSKLIGKKVDKDGKIWSESGAVIGTTELIPIDERDAHNGAPFEDFPDAIVNKDGHVIYDGQIVGRLVEGDAKKLTGKKVDPDGEVVDKIGNVLGKAERWDGPEEEVIPEAPKIDMSILAGKRVNKVGNVVDSHGAIYGRLVEGDPKKLAGKMCDKDGNVWNEGGTIVGRAELVPESEREGQKEGPFAGFDSAKVTKDGLVEDSKGTIIGRLIQGDGKQLYGKEVDSDGDVLDKNGNTIGRAERWEPEEKQKAHNPVAGRKVNREGMVVDENGDVIAKLTEGDIMKCSGKEIDEDGDVYNAKNQVIGHVTLLDDIPPEPVAEPEPEPEPTESPEEIQERKQLEQDRKLAGQLAMCIQQSLDKINPILKMITEAIDAADRQPKEELDEQKLVDTVRPLIEQGGMILTEANGVIRGLDPDGRIAANAQHKTASREATPEEYRLADVLKELAGNVTQTIENAKKKIAGMPHAKKELNPLWNLLAEPLGQIIAAVGLLLSGVLGLVGRLLPGLGLGGLLDNLLGGLGLKGILEGLGLGMVTKSLTGKK
jgi:hypothetical protein